MKKILFLLVIFIFAFSTLSFARGDIKETHVEIGAGIYVPDETGMSSAPEISIAYTFMVSDWVSSKAFISGYVLDPDKRYNEYDKLGTDFDTIPTLNIGATVFSYFPLGLTVDSYSEAGAFLTYQDVEYTKAGATVSEEEFSVGGLIGVGVRIEKALKISVNYRVQASDVDDGGFSAALTLSF